MKLATLCYIRSNAKTLMVHRVKKVLDIHKGKWNGLGGKFEPGETPEECVIREVYEESGLIISDPKLKGFLTFPKFANNEDWYAFVFLSEKFSGTLKESLEGYLRWINDDEMTNLALWDGDYIFLPYLDRPGFFSGKFVYENGELIDHSIVVYPIN